MAAIGLIIWLLNRRLFAAPLERFKDQAALIANDPNHLGDTVQSDLPGDFNAMSQSLKAGRDQLKDRVRERTAELRQALDEVKQLSGFIPICARCKKIRDEKGYWKQVETYYPAYEVLFSHGICPDCARKLYPEISGSAEEEANDED